MPFAFPPPEWNAGSVVALGANLSISNETLSATGGSSQWNAGTVNALGTGLTLAGGTLSASFSSNWNAGSVAAVGSGLAVNSNTLNLNTIVAHGVIANNSGAAAVPSGVNIVTMLAASIGSWGQGRLVYGTGVSSMGALSPGSTGQFLQQQSPGGNATPTWVGSFVANGVVATTLTGVGPTGANTTVQEWLALPDATGTTRYIPCF